MTQKKVGRLKNADRKNKGRTLEFSTGKSMFGKALTESRYVYFDARGSNAKTRIVVDVSDNCYGTVDDAFTAIKERILPYHPESTSMDLDMEPGRYYDEDGSPRLYVHVTRAALPVEVEALESQLEQENAAAKAYEDEEIERAKEILRKAGEL